MRERERKIERGKTRGTKETELLLLLRVCVCVRERERKIERGKTRGTKETELLLLLRVCVCVCGKESMREVYPE